MLSLTWSSLSWIIDPQAFTTATPYFVDNSEIEIGVSMPQLFPKKFTRRKQRWTAKIPFHAIDLSNNSWVALVKSKQKHARKAYWSILGLKILYLMQYYQYWFNPILKFICSPKIYVQNWVCRSKFCYGRYINNIGDILKLNWLPVEERRDFNLLKFTFKALHLNSGQHIWTYEFL